jgi:hypothetical protein
VTLTEPELAYLRRFAAEASNSMFGEGSIYLACPGHYWDLVDLATPEAQHQLGNTDPLPLPPEAPFPWDSLSHLHARAEEMRAS